MQQLAAKASSVPPLRIHQTLFQIGQKTHLSSPSRYQSYSQALSALLESRTNYLSRAFP